MLAVALLANLKEYREDRDLAGWHWNGLRKMIAINGGIQALRNFEDLHAYLMWLDVLICNTPTNPLGQTHAPSSSKSNVLRSITEEIIIFLDAISTYLSAMTDRPGSPEGKYAYTKWYRAKLASLIYLAALVQREESDPKSTEILSIIEAEILQREDHCIVIPEELFHIILRISNREGLCEMIWFVARLMSAIKQFDARDLNICYILLSKFLGLQSSSNAFDEQAVMKGWTRLWSRLQKQIQPAGMIDEICEYQYSFSNQF
ncbi:uncharacterized protein Z518_05674 [Rhinocladiella mackenziei CBS 650.93]|uniref:Uncharacterized protein n=1 Tax=Rhinocladiella mackenziei CBS 650.93 TaxID=1442369 RepID=A0A0D2H2Z2_9EURO|nr:uncharacterized protein Z518_05674 [Rhinocladiella mackenziei CBS 650.93]KIX04803.1 hypothetical protein Z518_05674 [Rhinocladiella mackenziei CBS 650.93]